jgi:Tol biopolymer transport system component
MGGLLSPITPKEKFCCVTAYLFIYSKMETIKRLIPALLRNRLLFLLVVVLSGCICTLAGLLFYRPGPAADSLVYVYEKNEAFGIFTIRPDGTDPLALFYSNPTPSRLVDVWESAPRALQRPLLHIIEQDIPYHPSWITGGRQISFRLRVHGRGCDEIITMEANGRNARAVTCLGRDYRDEAIAWSPDGNKLAVAHWEGSQTILALFDADGNLVRDFYLPAGVWGISWSPDSSRIAVTVDDDASLLIIQHDFIRNRYPLEASAFGQPAWSPDGERVAFFCVSNERIDICTLNANGTDYQRMYFPNKFPYLKYNLSWSPDGGKLAFEANQPSGYNDIFLVNVDGSAIRQLTFHQAADTDHTWSPDGSQIAFVSMRDGNWEIYRIRADGTSLIRVTNTPGHEREPAWRTE